MIRRRGEHLTYRARDEAALEVDWVIVGSGAGGGAAAVALARGGDSVAVVEAGPWRDPADYPSTVFGALRDMFAGGGMVTAHGDSEIPIVQAAAAGGSTTINSAILVRPPGDVLARWAQMGLGEVLTEEAVGEAAERALVDLSAEPAGGLAMAPHAAWLVDALEARGLEGHATLRAASACRGTQQCLQGCRSGAKRSVNVALLPEVLERGGVVISCAPVQRVVIERGVAVGVRGRFLDPATRARGARFRVRARRGVLVAASATGSGPLLARSGVRLPALGRGWRAHPGAGVIGLYEQETRYPYGTTQATSSMAFRESQGIKLESLHLPLELLAARIGGAGRRLTAALEEAPHMAMWVAAVNCEAEGTVRPAPGGRSTVRYQPTRSDTTRLRDALADICRLHFEMGARAVRPGIHGAPALVGPDDVHLVEEAPVDNRCYTWVLSHLFGGACIGSDPRTSVVAPDLAVWGVERLHVADAALLPTTLGVNPQLTIMAVATVVAERLQAAEVSFA